MRTITQTLNMTPGGVPPVIHVSQYDSDFTITFTLFSLFGGFTIESGTTAMVRGTKSSGTGYSADAAINISAKTVTVTGNAQMTAAAGQNIFEIVLKKNNKEISSKNFILLCERAALDADTITDESVLKELNAIIEGAETATQAAEEAEDAADRAEAAAQSLVIDSSPTQGSTNAVSSGGVYDALADSVTYTTQSKTVVKKAQARNNINAQEMLGAEYSENLFDSEDVTLNKIFYSSDAITTPLRNREGYFASGIIDVSDYDEITINGCEVIGAYGDDQSVISPSIQPQSTLFTPNTYTLDDSVKYIRVAGKIANIDSVYIRKPEFTIPNLKLTPEQTPVIDTSTLVSYTEAQNYRDAVRAQARENISAQESLGVEYSENLFDSEDVNLGKKFFATDPITMLRDDEVFFASNPINVSDCNEITIRGCEVVGAYDANQATITPKITPQNSMLIPATYDTSEINYIRVVGRIALINDVYIRKPDFTIPHLKLTPSQAAGNEYITPEMFGAVGDGETDDSNAFALTIADGRPIKLMAKTYKANLYINRSNVTIDGVFGVSKIIPADPTKPIIKINVDTAETISEIIDQIKLTDFKVYGGGNVIGISMRCCQYCILERLTIERCYTEAIRFRGVFDSKITDCDINTCGNAGFSGEDDGLGNYAITIDRTTGMNTNAIVFKGMRIELTPRMLKLQNTQQIMFSCCKFETHAKPYDTDSTIAPIKGDGTVKGVVFTNCVLTYSALLSDVSQPVLFNDGNPFVYMDLADVTTDADESYVLFSACQFRTQNNRAGVYFDVNHTNFVGCTFNRCDGSTDGNKLGKYSSLSDSNMMITNGVRALQIEGTQVLVDKTRINISAEDASTSIINVDSTATRGKVSVLYNGNDRNNLVDGTTGIPVEFIGLRSFPAT